MKSILLAVPRFPAILLHLQVFDRGIKGTLLLRKMRNNPKLESLILELKPYLAAKGGSREGLRRVSEPAWLKCATQSLEVFTSMPVSSVHFVGL